MKSFIFLGNALLMVVSLRSIRVQAAGLAGDPSVPRDGDGIVILDKNSMLSGFGASAPQTFTAISSDGTALVINGTEVVSQDDMSIMDATTPKENQDLSYLEWFYKSKFEMNTDKINAQWKQATVSKMPWPGSYWPAYQDGINVRWDHNGPSAAEKYAIANNLSAVDFMNRVSADSGIDAWTRGTTCTTDNQCASDAYCGIRYGKTSGYCVPYWVGICHAWAPAAMLEDEPKCPVEFNGVIFKPMDIKALMTQLYDGAGVPVLYSGVRFDGGDDNKKDQYGRYIDLAHRDIGPAMFHVICANVIGRFDKSFLIDSFADAEVWNQPVRSYAFSDPVVLSPDEAAKKYFNVSSYAAFNDKAVKVHYVQNTFKYIQEGYEDGQLSGPGIVDKYTETVKYEYLLELDADNNIIGGEWVNNSRYQHPDFVWVPLRKPEADKVTSLGISYSFVNMLNFLSGIGSC